jgi:WD40 repeat protein
LDGALEGPPGGVWSVAGRPDGRFLASGSADWKVHPWRLSDVDGA